MMFYTEPLPEPDPPLDKTELALIVFLTLAWMLPGLLGHEPWKPDEAYNFGLVRHMMESGNWLTFHLPDESPFASPPLYFMTAAVFGKLLSPILSLPDAMRLATGFYMGLALIFIALSGRILYGKGRYAVLILAGSLGLLGHAHQLIPDSALFAGCAMAILGFSMIGKNSFGGVLAGTGMGIGFMSKGLIAIAYFFPILLILPLMEKRGISFLLAALLSLLPWGIWPYLLHLQHPALFEAWWKSSFSDTLGLASAPRRSLFFYPGTLAWFAWPTLPLAAVALWRERTRLSDIGIRLPLLIFSVMLLVLVLTRTERELYAMPMLLPLSLLATASIARMRRSAASAFNWFGILTFGMMALLFWTGWIAMMTGHPAYIAAKIHHYHPDFSGHFSFFPFLFASLVTLLWVFLVIRTEHNGVRAVINWTSGIVMVWAILMTLWLPFLDSVKSYREMFLSMKKAMPHRYTCMKGRHLGDAQRAMLDYYLGIDTVKKGNCSLVLVQTVSSDRHRPEGLRKIWEGARAGDRKERYRLYEKGAE